MATPLKSIRAYCLWCCLDQPVEVRECPSTKWPLHPYRLNRMPGIKGQSALKAIRARCLDCVGWHQSDVKTCNSPCVLNQYRMGHNPNISEQTKNMRREKARIRGFGKNPRSTEPKTN